MEPVGVERSVWINAPISRVWMAVTDPSELSRWYATHYAWDIPRLEMGAQVIFHNSSTEALRATITALEPPHEFTLRWEPNSEYPDVIVVTSFLLKAEDVGTRMTLRETGYQTLPPDERTEWLRAVSGGYVMSVANLKALVEGEPLPYI